MKDVSDYKNVEFHIILTPKSSTRHYPCEKVCYTVGEDPGEGIPEPPINHEGRSPKERCRIRYKSEIYKQILKKSDKRHI